MNELIQEGERLLEALARNRFRITAALWSYFPESLEWRLVIVSPVVQKSGPMVAYTRVQRVLARINAVHLTLSDITVRSPSDQQYQNLRHALSSPSQSGAAARHIRNATFEDAYVYQM